MSSALPGHVQGSLASRLASDVFDSNRLSFRAYKRAWQEEYNTSRPHQSLSMGFPARRFTPADSRLDLRIPAQLTARTGEPEPAPDRLPA